MEENVTTSSQRGSDDRLAGLGRVALATSAVFLVGAVAAGLCGYVRGAAVLGPVSLAGVGLGAIMLRGGRRAAAAAVAFGAALALLACFDPLAHFHLALWLFLWNPLVVILCVLAAARYCAVGCAILVTRAIAPERGFATYRHLRAAEQRRMKLRGDVVAAIVFTLVCAVCLFSRWPRIG